MTLETSSCRQKQDPTWLEMMVWTAGKRMACRAVSCCHVNSISPLRTPAASWHEQKMTPNGVGDGTNFEKCDILRDGLAHGVFAGEPCWGDDLAILLYTQDYLGEGGSREMFVFAYFFVLCSSHSPLPSIFHPMGMGHLLSYCKRDLSSLFSGLQALDIPWYKIKHTVNFLLSLFMMPIKPCRSAVPRSRQPTQG
jgi:hypothetical protein